MKLTKAQKTLLYEAATNEAGRVVVTGNSKRAARNMQVYDLLVYMAKMRDGKGEAYYITAAGWREYIWQVEHEWRQAEMQVFAAIDEHTEFYATDADYAPIRGLTRPEEARAAFAAWQGAKWVQEQQYGVSGVAVTPRDVPVFSTEDEDQRAAAFNELDHARGALASAQARIKALEDALAPFVNASFAAGDTGSVLARSVEGGLIGWIGRAADFRVAAQVYNNNDKD